MDFSKFKINGTSTDVRMSQKVLLNYLQGDCERDNKGVTSWYEKGNLQASYIRIPKPDLLPALPRQLGASINGGSYSGSMISVSNEEYQLEILGMYDTAINIPYVNLDMIPELKESSWSEQIGKIIYKIKNGLCLATKVFQTFRKDKANGVVIEFDETKAADKYESFRSKLDDAEVALNDGDTKHGIDSFPETSRRITFANKITKYARETGSFIVGGSNFAQEMLKSGAFSPNDTVNVLEDGFRGIYGNIEMNMISNAKIEMADTFLGLPEGTILASGFCAVESSAYANIYGLSDNGVTIGEPELGRGKLLKPLYRFGAATLFTKGNAFIMEKGYTNPFAIFDILGVEPKVLGRGSRPIDLTVNITAAGVSAQTVTATKVNIDRTGAENEVTANVTKYAYVQSDAPITDVIAFVKAYNASGAVKGTADSGSITATLTKGKYFNVVALGENSTVSAVASKVVA